MKNLDFQETYFICLDTDGGLCTCFKECHNYTHGDRVLDTCCDDWDEVALKYCPTETITTIEELSDNLENQINNVILQIADKAPHQERLSKRLSTLFTKFDSKINRISKWFNHLSRDLERK